ncbi:hypothetical protein SS50377_22356 [Spironucleus salmonicida]|uniref:Uncharacterized protein n=1 Tax=Spironucleus salmonicida TaxID=348837 RepID=V6LN54_9EUKA|nr:hypothetical protein SS50377_22356 [Spironucleus salmonicida]|eukprot:EST42149.1 Hypothetical protein SS50377_18457 [Spironucleus salmonicida]
MDYQALVAELTKQSSPQVKRPEVVAIDLILKGQIIKFHVHNTDKPEFLADKVLSTYLLPISIRNALIEKFKIAINKLEPPKFQQSILNSTLQENDDIEYQELISDTSRLSPEVQAQPLFNQLIPSQAQKKSKTIIKKSYSVYDRLYQNQEYKNSQKFTQKLDNIRQTDPQIFQKLYQESFKVNIQKPVHFSPTLTKSQSENLLNRLTQQKKKLSPRYDNSNSHIKEHFGPEVAPKVSMNEISRSMTKHQTFEASNAYQTQIFIKKNQAEILENTTNLKIYDKLCKDLSIEEKIYYKERILSNIDIKKQQQKDPSIIVQPKNIVEKEVISRKNEHGRDEWSTVEKIYNFKPKINKNIISKSKISQIIQGQLEPKPQEPEIYSFKPEFHSKQLKQNEIKDKIISKLFV